MAFKVTPWSINGSADYENAKAVTKAYEDHQNEMQRRINEESRRKTESNNKVLKQIDKYMANRIKYGALGRVNVDEVISRVRIEGLDYYQAWVVKQTVRILTDPIYGVEKTTEMFGNGGLLLHAKRFEDPIVLYNHVMKLLGGYDPLQSPIWFFEILKLVFDEQNVGFLAAEVELPRFYKDFMPMIFKLLEAYRNPLQEDDMVDLVGEDKWFLMQLNTDFEPEAYDEMGGLRNLIG